MPWEKTYDRTELLERAMRAFWSRGYEATSVADLVKATGVNRGSLYSAYDDKRDLFLAAIRHYDRTRRVQFLSDLGAKHSPRRAIVEVFKAAARQDPETPKGCLLVNTALEMSPHDREVAALVNRCLDSVQTFFLERIRAGQAAGEIAAHLDAEEAARGLLGLFMGLRVATRAGRDDATLKAIADQANTALG